MRSARLIDVARAAGVSQGTASNVFNRPAIVRPEVRERVESCARRLGYSGPDPKGRILRAGKVNAIGVVLGDAMTWAFRDPYMRLLMDGIAEECDAHGAGLALVSASREQQASWGIQTAVVDGLIVNCLQVASSLVALARERRLPLVAIDDAGPGMSSIRIDDRGGAQLAGRHLLELGHRKIAILSLQTGLSEHHGFVEAEALRSSEWHFLRERAAGYAAALAEQGIELDGLPIVECPESPSSRAQSTSLASELFAANPDTTAILAMSDVLGLAAIDAARARGLRVPEDLSVVGFDDVREAATSDPPLTTAAQPIVEKGRLAARLVLEGSEPRSEVLPVKLVVRGSTAPPRKP